MQNKIAKLDLSSINLKCPLPHRRASHLPELIVGMQSLSKCTYNISYYVFCSLAQMKSQLHHLWCLPCIWRRGNCVSSASTTHISIKWHPHRLQTMPRREFTAKSNVYNATFVNLASSGKGKSLGERWTWSFDTSFCAIIVFFFDDDVGMHGSFPLIACLRKPPAACIPAV